MIGRKIIMRKLKQQLSVSHINSHVKPVAPIKMQHKIARGNINMYLRSKKQHTKRNNGKRIMNLQTLPQHPQSSQH